MLVEVRMDRLIPHINNIVEVSPQAFCIVYVNIATLLGFSMEWKTYVPMSK